MNCEQPTLFDMEHTPCPCGYTTECPIWCGYGHETGQCPEFIKPWVKIELYMSR